MEQEIINNGNRLIAKLEGKNIYDKETTYENDMPMGAEYVDELKYHTSWDCLKPAIDKFLAIPIETFNYNATAMNELRRCKISLGNKPISSGISFVWNELIASIKWYNLQNK